MKGVVAEVGKRAGVHHESRGIAGATALKPDAAAVGGFCPTVSGDNGVAGATAVEECDQAAWGPGNR
jgi:hypothetical protein